jgi:hypothetical protein
MLLKLGLALDNVMREYTDTVVALEDTKDRVISAWVDRVLGRRFSVSFVLSRYEREATDRFDENRYEVRFSYSPTGSSSAALPFAGR